MDDLALQVGLVDGVELDDAERADARRGEVHQRRRAEAAGADAEHLGVLQPLLPGHPDVRDDQVAAVAADLVDGQLSGRLDQGWQRHDPTPSQRQRWLQRCHAEAHSRVRVQQVGDRSASGEVVADPDGKATYGYPQELSQLEVLVAARRRRPMHQADPAPRGW